MPITPVREAAPSEDVALYVVQAPSETEIVLDDEHDQFFWLPLEEAVPMCRPDEVGAGLTNASAWLDARATAA